MGFALDGVASNILSVRKSQYKYVPPHLLPQLVSQQSSEGMQYRYNSFHFRVPNVLSDLLHRTKILSSIDHPALSRALSKIP